MPKTMSLKSSVTKRAPAAVPPDQAERLAQAEHHQAAEALESTPEPSNKALKREMHAHALQVGFLNACLGKSVTVYLLNGVRLFGRIKQFDQYCLLLEGADGPCLVFKHAISTIQPAGQPTSDRQDPP